MRKIYIIFLLTFLLLLLTGCQSDIVTYTIESPYHISFDVGSNIWQLDLKVPIKDVRVISNLNGTVNASYEGSLLNLNYDAEGNNIKYIPYEVLNFFGYSLGLHNSTIEVDILEKDINKFNRKFIENFITTTNKKNSAEVIIYDNEKNHFTFNYVDIAIQNIYTGEVDLSSITLDPSIPLKQFLLEFLSPIFKKLETESRKHYLENNTYFLEKLEKIFNMCSTDEEKISAIVFWASTIKYEDDMIPEGKGHDYEYSYKQSVDYTCKTRRGNCVNSAYFIKACLDALGIENRLVSGYIPSADAYHVINAIKYNKDIDFTDDFINHLIELNPDMPIKETLKINEAWIKSDWIWIDGLPNYIDKVELYTNFQAFREFNEDELK